VRREVKAAENETLFFEAVWPPIFFHAWGDSAAHRSSSQGRSSRISEFVKAGAWLYADTRKLESVKIA
jgi:hypothetical protein